MALVGIGAELEAEEDIFEDALETISMHPCAAMATSSHHFASCHTKQASGQHRSSTVSRSGRGCGRSWGTRREQSNPLADCSLGVRAGPSILLTGGIVRGLDRCCVRFTS